MKESIETTGRNLFWVSTQVTNKVVLIWYLAVALFIFRIISPWHLLATGLGGLLIALVTWAVVGWRVEKKILRGISESGFTDEEIQQLPTSNR